MNGGEVWLMNCNRVILFISFYTTQIIHRALCSLFQPDTGGTRVSKCRHRCMPHPPLSLHEMCTHLSQPLTELLAGERANHKLTTISRKLEWGDVSHLQILTCRDAVSSGGSVHK